MENDHNNMIFFKGCALWEKSDGSCNLERGFTVLNYVR